MNMKETEKIAWIDREKKILSFHEIENGKKIQKTERLFWNFVCGLMNAGYRIM